MENLKHMQDKLALAEKNLLHKQVEFSLIITNTIQSDTTQFKEITASGHCKLLKGSDFLNSTTLLLL